jgi:tRNA pseudouridine38-40 synthase
VWAPLDAAAMAAAAETLLGEHDFGSFQAADCDAESAVRRIIRSEVQLVDGQLLYTVEATAFLRHMVRNLVGTLVEVGSKARSPEEFSALLGLRDRRRAGATAPARGLCLREVRYADTPPADLERVG